MKKFAILIVVIIAVSICHLKAQITFTKINEGDNVLNTIPRLSMDFGLPINIIGPYAIINNQAMGLETGLFVTNTGFAFDSDSLRYIHRLLGVNIPLRISGIINNKIYLGAGHNFNFPFHYKSTTFTARSRENKQIVTKEFMSDKTAKFYPSLELSAGISFHGVGRFSLRVQTFYMSFFNPAYSENINGTDILPYQTTVFNQNLRIIISYNPAL